MDLTIVIIKQYTAVPDCIIYHPALLKLPKRSHIKTDRNDQYPNSSSAFFTIIVKQCSIKLYCLFVCFIYV